MSRIDRYICKQYHKVRWKKYGDNWKCYDCNLVFKGRHKRIKENQ